MSLRLIYIVYDSLCVCICIYVHITPYHVISFYIMPIIAVILFCSHVEANGEAVAFVLSNLMKQVVLCPATHIQFFL